MCFVLLIKALTDFVTTNLNFIIEPLLDQVLFFPRLTFNTKKYKMALREINVNASVTSNRRILKRQTGLVNLAKKAEQIINEDRKGKIDLTTSISKVIHIKYWAKSTTQMSLKDENAAYFDEWRVMINCRQRRICPKIANANRMGAM